MILPIENLFLEKLCSIKSIENFARTSFRMISGILLSTNIPVVSINIPVASNPSFSASVRTGKGLLYELFPIFYYFSNFSAMKFAFTALYG